jgi:hypothetical protein
MCHLVMCVYIYTLPSQFGRDKRGFKTSYPHHHPTSSNFHSGDGLVTVF